MNSKCWLILAVTAISAFFIGRCSAPINQNITGVKTVIKSDTVEVIKRDTTYVEVLKYIVKQGTEIKQTYNPIDSITTSIDSLKNDTLKLKVIDQYKFDGSKCVLLNRKYDYSVFFPTITEAKYITINNTETITNYVNNPINALSAGLFVQAQQNQWAFGAEITRLKGRLYYGGYLGMAKGFSIENTQWNGPLFGLKGGFIFNLSK